MSHGSPAGAVLARRRPRRRKLAVWLILLASLALWCGRFAYLRITLRPTPRPEYWEAQVARLDPPPPGAISPSEALVILSNRPWDAAIGTQFPYSHRYVASVLELPWDRSREDIVAAIARFTSDTFESSRAKLKEALATGWRDTLVLAPDPTRYDVGPQYGAWRLWLAAHSRWAIEENADYDAAVEDWLMILGLGRQARRARTVFALEIEAALTDAAAGEMSFAADSLGGRVESLALAQKVADIVGAEPPPRELVAGERLYWLSVLEHIYVREGRDWLDVSEAAGVVSRFTSMGWAPPSRLWNLTSPVFDGISTARGNVDEVMATLDGAATLAAARRLARTPSSTGLGPLEGTPTWIGGPWGLSSAADCLARYYQARCRLEAALTLVALQEYRVRHGRYPDGLAALVPDFLPRLPIDYADRQPLRYCLTDGGFLLYSIGADGKDDGGQCAQPLTPWRQGNADAVLSDARRREVSP